MIREGVIFTSFMVSKQQCLYMMWLALSAKLKQDKSANKSTSDFKLNMVREAKQKIFFATK